jgi:hypothetical protein
MLKPYTQKPSTEPQPSQREAATYQKQTSSQLTREYYHYNSASSCTVVELDISHWEEHRLRVFGNVMRISGPKRDT